MTRSGAHLVIADFNLDGAKRVSDEAAKLSSPEFTVAERVDLASAESLAGAVRRTIQEFGGIDFIVNTAAVYPVPSSGAELSEAEWAKTFQVNVTGTLLARAAEWVFEDQKLPCSLVLTSSANAVVTKKGSEAYDTSKTALNHLIHELAIKLGPTVRVNGIAPATVVARINNVSARSRDAIARQIQDCLLRLGLNGGAATSSLPFMPNAR